MNIPAHQVFPYFQLAILNRHRIATENLRQIATFLGGGCRYRALHNCSDQSLHFLRQLLIIGRLLRVGASRELNLIYRWHRR